SRNERVPTGWIEQCAEHADQRRLACPIGTQEPVDLAVGHGEIYAVEGVDVAKGATQITGLNGQVRHCRSLKREPELGRRLCRGGDPRTAATRTVDLDLERVGPQGAGPTVGVGHGDRAVFVDRADPSELPSTPPTAAESHAVAGRQADRFEVGN